MECKFEEQICAAVDRCLPETEMASFLEHAQQCPPCRREFEMQGAVKSFIAKGMHRLAVPEDLRDCLHRQVLSSPPPSAVFDELFRRQFFRPALALGIIALVVIFYYVRPTSEPGIKQAGIGNIIEQSLANYFAVMNGTIEPQVKTSEAQIVKNFFEGKTGFEVLVPQIRECTLVGGVLNEASPGVPLAHVVYTDQDNRLLYLYQACWDNIDAKHLYLPDSVRSSLVRTKWYTETRADGHTIVLWLHGRTLCAAVAHMDKEELLACLQSDETLQ